MLLRGSFTGPLNALILYNHTIKWVTHARLLGVTIDNKLTWPQRILEVRKSFVNKLNLLKRSSFYHVIYFWDNLSHCILCVADMGKLYSQALFFLPRNILLDILKLIVFPIYF